MKKQFLFLTTGLLLGGLCVFAWTEARHTTALNDALTERDARISLLETDLSGARASGDEWRTKFQTAGLDDSPVRENVLDIQRLLNDARPFLKSLTLMFGDQRQRMTERMIRGMAEKLAADMNLTEEQTADMIAHFIALDGENFEKIKDMLDRKMTVFDVFSTMSAMNPQKAMDQWATTSLSEEQRGAWDTQKLETKAQQLERNATSQLDRMTRDLKLDETQKDQIFGILVKTSPDYDPALALEGVGAATSEAEEITDRDAAIAAVLRDEQQEGWSKEQERQNSEKQRWTDALGGLDPGEFFRSMGNSRWGR